MWATGAIGFWLSGLLRESAMVYSIWSRLKPWVVWPLRIMASCMRGLGERVRLEQHSRGILSCPVKAHVWRSRYKIYRELAHGAAHRRWRRDTDSP